MISKAGMGIRMEGSCEDKEALRQELNTEQIQYLNKEERQHLLIFELLRSDEVQKLLHYGALFQVSEATISNDLDCIEPWFQQHDLSLIRKPGVGVGVQGEEAVLRKAMTQLLQEHLQNKESYESVNFLDSQTLLTEIFLHQDAGILNMLNQDILNMTVCRMKLHSSFAIFCMPCCRPMMRINAIFLWRMRSFFGDC